MATILYDGGLRHIGRISRLPNLGNWGLQAMPVIDHNSLSGGHNVGKGRSDKAIVSAAGGTGLCIVCKRLGFHDI